VRILTFVPCVYGLPGDAVTWTALARAIANAVPCGGLWLSRPLLQVTEPQAWQQTLAPTVDPGAPVLLWQYAFGRKAGPPVMDRDLVNPAIDAQNDLLAHLVPPPGSTAPAVPAAAPNVTGQGVAE